VAHKFKKAHVRLITNNRVFKIKSYGKYLRGWRYKIEKAILDSSWSPKLERFVMDGFAPTRRQNKMRICIDGEQYFKRMIQELNNATYEIYISDWWMVPQYYLARPVTLDNEDDMQYRLD